MREEQRTFLALLIASIFLFFYSWFFLSKSTQRKPEPPKIEQKTAQEAWIKEKNLWMGKTSGALNPLWEGKAFFGEDERPFTILINGNPVKGTWKDSVWESQFVKKQMVYVKSQKNLFVEYRFKIKTSKNIELYIPMKINKSLLSKGDFVKANYLDDWKFRKIKKNAKNVENPMWMAVHSRYLAAVLFLKKGLKLWREKRKIFISIPPGDYDFRFIIALKKYSYLRSLGLDLHRLTGMGFFSHLFLSLLLFFRKHTGDSGVAIILLAFIVKVLLHPLSATSTKSMRKIQQLQPKIKQLQKKYANDPQKLNQELVKLYRKEGISPFSGCLPLLLQIPIFIWLFTALRNAAELRGAHSILLPWIKDLSGPDPFYILPILMGASMYLQQRLSATAEDPTQKSMSIILPIIFTIFFLSFPSGLVFYWLLQNLFGILESLYIKKKFHV